MLRHSPAGTDGFATILGKLAGPGRVPADLHLVQLVRGPFADLREASGESMSNGGRGISLRIVVWGTKTRSVRDLTPSQPRRIRAI